jgi:hypothetical protein
MPAGLTKSSALRGAHRDVTADERVVAGLNLVAAGVRQTLRTAYPDLYTVHDPSGGFCGSAPAPEAPVEGVDDQMANPRLL